MKRTIGVLALQGAFAKHRQVLEKLDVKCIEVRKPHELDCCDALIVPGGESTSMMNRISFIDFTTPLNDFATTKPVFGTCAGLILMSKHIVNHCVKPFGWLDVTVQRNGFGRQIESFDVNIPWLAGKGKKNRHVTARFIRAPRIVSVGKEVNVLAEYNGEPVCVQSGNLLATTFHPELTDDTTLHQYFLNFLKKCRV